MWNKSTSVLKILLSNRQIVLALALSLLLHFFLIKKFYYYLPDANSEHQVIAAQLIFPEKEVALAPSIEPPKPDAQPEHIPTVIKPKKIKQKKRVQQPTNLAEQAVADSQFASEQLAELLPEQEKKVEEMVQTASPAVETDPKEIVSHEAETQQSASTDEVNQAVEEDVKIDINPNVYQHVSTSFDVFTDKDPALRASPVGVAKIDYSQLQGSNQYHIKSLIQPKGLASLLVPDLLQTSEGEIGNAGLQPKQYLYQFGDRKNKTYRAEFDWQSKQLSLHNAKGSQTLALSEGTQDLLSFMYQFMFLQPLQSMEMRITNGKKVGVYTYSFEGEESLETKIGTLNTVHLLRASGENDKKTEIWLALDYQYVPVKIRETAKDGKVYELIVSSLQTTP